MSQRSKETFKTKIHKWGKLLLAQKHLRFYPPSFIIRNPILEGVNKCVKQGDHAVVIVFNIPYIVEFTEKFGTEKCDTYKDKMKSLLEDAVKNVFSDESILSLHTYSSSGIALILRTHPDKKSIIEMESLIQETVENVKRFEISEKDCPLPLETGYTIIENTKTITEEGLVKAYLLANALAEKKIQSKSNDLLLEMTNIITRKEIQLLAQPIIDVSSNQIKAWEILSRGPKGTKLESPLDLFSVAKKTNQLFALELIVLEKAFEQIITTRCDQLVFINFTPITLGNTAIIKEVKRLLAHYEEVDPYKIIIEITERDSIEEYKYFVDNIKALREMGFRIAVDDTGAGYASLHTISEVLPDIIKIDRSVIQDIDTNSVKESMLKGLLLIAKETGSIVVAEGIEKEGEASVLSRNKVDLAQGYFYAKPDKLPSMVSCL